MSEFLCRTRKERAAFLGRRLRRYNITKLDSSMASFDGTEVYLFPDGSGVTNQRAPHPAQAKLDDDAMWGRQFMGAIHRTRPFPWQILQR